MDINLDIDVNQLLPGEPLRLGVDLIANKGAGGLIVVGTSNKLEKISKMYFLLKLQIMMNHLIYL